MSKKKEIDVLKEIQALAKKLGGTHPYDEKIKIDGGNRAIWTNGFILIRAQIGSVYPPGLYNARDMSPLVHNNYPNTDQFFETPKTLDCCDKMLNAARKVKPFGKDTVGITREGSIDLTVEMDGCLNLAVANTAIGLGLTECAIDDRGIYILSNGSKSIVLISPSMRSIKGRY